MCVCVYCFLATEVNTEKLIHCHMHKLISKCGYNAACCNEQVNILTSHKASIAKLNVIVFQYYGAKCVWSIPRY